MNDKNREGNNNLIYDNKDNVNIKYVFLRYKIIWGLWIKMLVF